MINMKYAIITTSGSHDYDIEVIKTEQSTSYSMTYSKAEHWNLPGDHILTITDDGDNMHFNPKLKKLIDYAQFFELSVLTDFIKSFDKILMEEYNVYQLNK